MDNEDDVSQSEGSDYSDDGDILGHSMTGDALARTLVEANTANELGLVRSEVKRLRAKVANLEHEKDLMVDNFRITNKVLIERIKELEAELSETKSRPQTAAVLEHIEHSKAVSSRHVPEVMRIEEEPGETSSLSPTKGRAEASDAAARSNEFAEPCAVEEFSICGNCGQSIPTGNFTTHSVFCYRNNFRCSGCDEVISLRDKDKHLQEWTDPERLINAVSAKDVDTLQKMSSHGADFGAAAHPTTGDTVLHVAARLNNQELIELFMGYGVDAMNPVNGQGDMPIHIAAELADTAVVKLLVELGANLNALNGKDESPLMLVCRRGAAEAAHYLCEMKADAEARTKLGDTPLEIAQRLGHQDTVSALCMAGAPLRPGSGTPKRSSSRVRDKTRSSSRSRRERSSSRPKSGSPRVLVGQPGAAGGSSMPAPTGGYPPLPPRRPPLAQPPLVAVGRGAALG
mmetsp:Transcript_96709/g.181850  ORF Transcript_96709/g.181850 Transcript_96709/m.181850 type:complete len:458 (-) Transcript_96709:56-1429(-)